MPIEIQELHIKGTVTPREVISRIVKAASSGPAGMNSAIRGVQKLAASEEGAQMLKEITQKYTLFNDSGTPVRAVFSRAWPAKFKGATQKAGSAARFNPNEFSIAKSTKWTQSKAAEFVNACLGNNG